MDGEEEKKRKGGEQGGGEKKQALIFIISLFFFMNVRVSTFSFRVIVLFSGWGGLGFFPRI